MITLNQFKASPCFTGIQREQNKNKENMPVLKQLNADIVSFKGIEAEYLRKIAAGKLDSHIIGTLLEGPLSDKMTPELQEAFNAAYKSGIGRKTLNAYLERRPELKKPE